MQSSSGLYALSVRLVLGYVLLAFCRRVYRRWKYPRPLPPGPLPLPIVGNAHQLPLEYPYRKLSEWAQSYGPLVYTELFRTPTIVISSVKVARDLMVNRSGNYSDRPDFVLLEMMGWKTRNVLTQLRYGEVFHRHRKWAQTALQAKTASLDIEALQRRAVGILLGDLISRPEAFRAHFTRFISSMIIEIVYGHKVTSMDDELVHIVHSAAQETSTTGGSALTLLVDFFPLLAHYPLWLPGSGWKINVERIRGIVTDMFDTPYTMVKNAVLSGTAVPCLASSLIEEHLQQGDLTEIEDEIKGISGIMYGAGTDTTAAVLNNFILAMVLNPSVFARAQQEVDAVVDRDRLPSFTDRTSLPYVECVLKEVYRWSPPLPIGLPHRTMADDQYEGFHIPGDITVLPNIWAMTRDKDNFPDPEVFRPERFLDASSAQVADPKTLIFGFGRRVCPGQQFADSSIFLVITNILATMTISAAKNERGEDIIPPERWSTGLVSHVIPFPCLIQPRSVRSVVLIERTNMSA